MATFVQICVGGLVLGAVYALVALSLNIVFVMCRVVNFAQGDIGMVAVMGTIGLNQTVNLPVAAAVALGLVAAGVTAALVDLIAVRPLSRVSGFGAYSWMVSTLGASIALQNGAGMIFGTDSRAFPYVVFDGQVSVFGTSITYQQFSTIAIVALLILVAGIVVRRTQWGLAVRAIAENSSIASSQGINVNYVRTVVVALSGILVGIAAVLVAPQIFANPFIGTSLLLNGFIAIILGGLGNIPGGLAGGLALGLLYSLTGWFAPPIWVPYVPFIVLLLWITFTPAARAGIDSLIRSRHRDTALHLTAEE